MNIVAKPLKSLKLPGGRSFGGHECIGKCSMPFKTSPTQQIQAFQRLQ